MKKALALFCLVVVLSAGVCGFEFFKVNAQKENVSFTVMKEEGNKKYANGLNVHLVQQHLNRLTWRTDYTFGETDKVKTEFEFHRKALNDNTVMESYFNIYSSTAGSFSSTDGTMELKPIGINKAYLELAEEAQPYVRAEKTVRLKDYFEYYPIQIDAHFDNYGLCVGNDFEDSIYDSYTEEEEDFKNRLIEFLRIPVRENETLTISLTKTESGDICEIGSSRDHEKFYSINALAVVSKDTVYFIIGNRTESGEKVDTSLIPGGYGIYAFDYTLKDKHENGKKLNGDYLSKTASFGEIKTIYPLSEDNKTTGFFLSEDESELYLFTNENGSSYMTVIDAKNHKCRQKLKISDGEKEGFSLWKNTDDYMVLGCYDDNCEHLIVLTAGKDGKYKLEYMTESKCGSFDQVTIYENGLLYVAYNGFHDYDIVDKYDCGFTVLVYSKDGLEYYGEYLSSLNTGNSKNYAGGYYIYSYVEPSKIFLA